MTTVMFVSPRNVLGLSSPRDRQVVANDLKGYLVNHLRNDRTAASMWTMAIVGLSIGAGYFAAGVATTVILFVILAIVNVFEERTILSYSTLHLIVEADDRPGLVAHLKTLLKGPERHVKTFGLDKNLDEQTVMIEVVLHIFHKETPEGITEKLSNLEGIHRVKVRE